MNSVVASITYRAMLGRKRVWLLALLPVALIAIAVLLRLIGAGHESTTVTLMETFAIGAILPLLGLIAGTGVIAPEIEDGTIIHLLSKPIPRHRIMVTKFAVAASLMVVFAGVPTFLAGYLMIGTEANVAAGFALGAAIGGIAYAAVFLLVGVLTKHAVVVGIIYALVWEGAIGGYVPGARKLSIQQWARTLADQVTTSPALKPDVALSFALPAIVIVTVVAVIWAGQRLRGLSLTGDE
ncbi:ABC transporter permease [Acrocarpospora phusangensis]|uniref:ABC transporter permease n=1 Tax=Acrocarpospora phusangensis TaxID=1070424 RepID=A0A919QMU3_9ACTN|nr:ABC transporter permease subunit [Acrocarpospora phusangensis]GIH29155.1 ABC transporter permease [Acrocarpospora phusangensis]